MPIGTSLQIFNCQLVYPPIEPYINNYQFYECTCLAFCAIKRFIKFLSAFVTHVCNVRRYQRKHCSQKNLEVEKENALTETETKTLIGAKCWYKIILIHHVWTHYFCLHFAQFIHFVLLGTILLAFNGLSSQNKVKLRRLLRNYLVNSVTLCSNPTFSKFQLINCFVLYEHGSECP